MNQKKKIMATFLAFKFLYNSTYLKSVLCEIMREVILHSANRVIL